ncbi:MAG TPA: hypothetical protein VJP45_10355 [Candidatus Limnocylindria bacterium]|nr:hypothetical protein [Candidatus Limnocylindria bacterium]
MLADAGVLATIAWLLFGFAVLVLFSMCMWLGFRLAVLLVGWLMEVEER